MKLGLGLDAGGTQTRWALASPSGEIVAEGSASGMTGLQMGSDAGRAQISATLAAIASAALAAGKPARIVAGMTGIPDGGHEAAALASLIGESVGLAEGEVTLSGDVEIAYLDAFAPGEGYLVYAGTGSIAAFIDAKDVCHRVGGHGGILDDGGSGFWIGAQALKAVWRAEDERPGASLSSPLAREVFARVGGTDWNASRQFVYSGGFEANRGKVGGLALAVAAAAPEDQSARAILAAAGAELGRLAHVLTTRFGPRPVTLSGRVFELHPLIEAAVCAALPEDTRIVRRVSEAHLAAARIAAK